MPSIMQDIKSLHPLLFFFIFEPLYLALKQLTTGPLHTCQVTLDISGSPIENQWGSQKYPR